MERPPKISRRRFLIGSAALASSFVLGSGCGVATNESDLPSVAKQEPTPKIVSVWRTKVTSEELYEENLLRARIENALQYMEGSDNQTLLSISQFIRQRHRLTQPAHRFNIVAEPPVGLSFVQINPEPIDFYFQQTQPDFVIPYLVISTEFITQNNLTDEELAVILAQKTEVFQALRNLLPQTKGNEYISAGDFISSLNSPEVLALRKNLEIPLWYGIANQVIFDLESRGLLKSDRLRALIPKQITDPPLVDPHVWQDWAENLPATVLPGLSKQ